MRTILDINFIDKKLPLWPVAVFFHYVAGGSDDADGYDAAAVSRANIVGGRDDDDKDSEKPKSTKERKESCA